jgi:hypothetical protein
MKCESVQKRILLAQSGELSWFGRLSVSSHLRGCAACRQFEAALNGITSQVHGSEADLSVGAAVLDRIQHAARKESSRSELIHIRPSHEPFSSIFRPAIIYSAAALMLLVGFWLTVRPALNQPQVAEQKATPTIATSGDWDTAGIDTQIETLDDWLDVASTDGDISDETNGNETEDVNSIARQLLEMESEQI